MDEVLEKCLFLSSRIIGLWIALSFAISLIPLLLFTFSSNSENMDTERLIAGFNLFSEWLRWLVSSQVQLSSIIGTIIINLGYEYTKNKRSL